MRGDQWLINQLPVSMAEDDFLVRYLTMLQNVSDTVFHQIDNLPHTFDATVAPEPMVRTMAEWFGVDWVDSSLDERLQREIVLRYSEMIAWRGTRRGLTAILEVLSDGAATVEDSGGVFPEGECPSGPELVRIELESTGWTRLEDLVRIIGSELPASVAFDLWIGGDRVWSSEEQALAQLAEHARDPMGAFTAEIVEATLAGAGVSSTGPNSSGPNSSDPNSGGPAGGHHA